MTLSIRVVAFDLDDTLIRLAPDFIPQYFRLLDNRLQERFPNTKPLSHAIGASSLRLMQKPRDVERLEDFFYRDFAATAGVSGEVVRPAFESFYTEDFPALRAYARPIYGAMGLLTAIKEAGYQVALLTSALFPTAAIDERLRWAGLEGFPFDWRTSFEAVHATKPQTGYYLEAADGLGIPPEEWLMVGNDVVEDIVPANAAGMQVYWVHDDAVDSLPDGVPSDAPHGPVERVLNYLGLEENP